jgi:hypothetical protein
MVDQTELEICRRRGHSGAQLLGWTQCAWCGTWLREVTTTEEREDDPVEHGVMIDQTQLAICRKRGHRASLLSRQSGWTQCTLCGLWLRAVTTTEEREDEPDEEDLSLLDKAKRQSNRITKLSNRIGKLRDSA